MEKKIIVLCKTESSQNNISLIDYTNLNVEKILTYNMNNTLFEHDKYVLVFACFNADWLKNKAANKH